MDKQKLLSDLPSVDEIVKFKKTVSSGSRNFRESMLSVRSVNTSSGSVRPFSMAGFEEAGMEDLLPEIERHIEISCRGAA